MYLITKCILLLVIFQSSVNAFENKDAGGKDAEEIEDYVEIQEDEEIVELPPVIEQGPARVTRVLDIGDGDKAWVIDDAIKHQLKESYLGVIQGSMSPVRFTFMHMNYSKADLDKPWNYGSAPWVKPVDLEYLKSLPIWLELQPVVEKAIQKEVFMEYGQLQLLRALDAMPPAVNEFCAPNRYMLTLFLGHEWRLNNYGQVSFYSKMRNPNITSEPRWEITESVHPHVYRALLWPSCHKVLFRAPCVNYFNHMPYLNIYFTTDENSKGITVPFSLTKKSDAEKEDFGHFTFDNSDANRTIDYDKCLLRTFYDRTQDRPIHIFDGLFTTEELRAWRTHLLGVKAAMNPFDPAPLQDHDNVQWMSQYNIDKFLQTDMWPRLQGLLKYVSNETDWSPYDVALNFIRAADHTRIHPDSEPHQTEFTMLLYLSEGMKPSEYGETMWMVRRDTDGVHEFLGPGGDLYETIAAVAPKFGRMVVFRNNIEHSAHPPSTLFLGGRYSFAVKVSRNLRLAFVKRIYEGMEKVDMSPTLKTVNRQLQMGAHDDPTKSPLTDSHLKRLYKKIIDMASNANYEEYQNELKQPFQNL
uniref:Uncharacterized protein LOC100176023 n=1 Tax=Phallusia mammillata TaxID=59560 RepID=A0A6F9DGW7_9ASCI|nr:uncharacterized protein LOC100176023 [Phallusia mammillata]